MRIEDHPVQHGWVTYAITFAIVAVVMGLRLRSMTKERPLKLATLWIVPVVYLLLAASMLYALFPPPLGWGLLLAGLGVGLGLGWHRGKLIQIDRDPATGALTQKASPLAMILLLALVVLKLGARAIFGESAAGQPGSSAMLLTDAFIGFALGLLSATRLELYLRGRRIIENG
jgi:hypothetical protein